MPYTCTPQGSPTVIVGPADAPGATFDEKTLFVLEPPSGSAFHIVAYDKASRQLFMRSAHDLTDLSPIATWMTPDAGDSAFTEGEATAGELRLRGRTTGRLGELTVPFDGAGFVSQDGQSFNDYALPTDCTSAPAHPNKVALGSDASKLIECIDGATPATASLYLDGTLVDAGTDLAQFDIAAYHVVAGTRVVFTTHDLTSSYFRIGANAGALAHASRLSALKGGLTAVSATAPGSDAMKLLLTGFSFSGDMSSFSFIAGRVAPTRAALAAIPPAGVATVTTATNEDKMLFAVTQPSFDGAVVAIAGASVSKHAVLLDLLDENGTPLATDVTLAASPAVTIDVAAASRTKSPLVAVAWIENETTIKAQVVLCTKTP